MNRKEEKTTQQKVTHVAFSSEKQSLPKWTFTDAGIYAQQLCVEILKTL